MVPLNESARVSHCAPQTAGSYLRRLSCADYFRRRDSGLTLPRKSASATDINTKNPPQRAGFFALVPLIRIGLTTPSLPMTCSTTELQRHNLPRRFEKLNSNARISCNNYKIHRTLKKSTYFFSIFAKFM